MKISELISQLKEIEKIHGDLPCKIGAGLIEVERVNFRSDPITLEGDEGCFIPQKLALCRVALSA